MLNSYEIGYLLWSLPFFPSTQMTFISSLASTTRIRTITFEFSSSAGMAAHNLLVFAFLLWFRLCIMLIRCCFYHSIWSVFLVCLHCVVYLIQRTPRIKIKINKSSRGLCPTLILLSNTPGHPSGYGMLLLFNTGKSSWEGCLL